ncbi:TPA: hypothetical protein ACQTWV_004531 [Enterobacter roggenkampii]
MKQRLPAYLYQNKLSDEQRNLNNTAHNVFWLLTLIASYTPDKNTVYLNFHRATSIAQQEGYKLRQPDFIGPSMN